MNYPKKPVKGDRVKWQDVNGRWWSGTVDFYYESKGRYSITQHDHPTYRHNVLVDRKKVRHAKGGRVSGTPEVPERREPEPPYAPGEREMIRREGEVFSLDPDVRRTREEAPERACCIHDPHDGPCPNWSLVMNEVTGLSLYDDANDLALPCGHLTAEEAEACRDALNEVFWRREEAPEGEATRPRGAGEPRYVKILRTTYPEGRTTYSAEPHVFDNVADFVVGKPIEKDPWGNRIDWFVARLVPAEPTGDWAELRRLVDAGYTEEAGQLARRMAGHPTDTEEG